MATKWFSMDSAPTNRDFMVELANGYISRARLHNGKHLGCDSMGPNNSDTTPLGWSELPTPMKKKAKAKGSYTEEFERDVWAPYPRKEGTSKANAFKRFQALSDSDRALCIAAIPIYARQKAGSDVSYIKHLEFFIGGKVFETIGAANVIAVPGAPAAPVDWQRILRIYRQTNNWNASHGPAPGQPGCVVPIAELRKAGF